MKYLTFLILSFYSFWAVAQDVKPKRDIDFFLDVLGRNGILATIGIIVFLYCYKNSIKIFNWIDEQTYGTRNYILKKFEIMFIEVEPEKVTWVLLLMSFGTGVVVFCVLAFMGNITLAILLGIVTLVLGWKIPKPLVDFFENRRKRKYQVQM